MILRFVIVSKDTDNCRKILDEFAKEFNKEYKKRLGSWKFKIIKRIIPIKEWMNILESLKMHVVEEKEKNEFTLVLPIKAPEFKKLRMVIKKITGREPSPKWKERLVENLEKCLKKNNVSYENVECFGE